MFAKNENGTIKYLSVVTKPAADTPANPYRTGYGAKIPSGKLALVSGKWQRVYVACYSNIGSAWVQIKGERVCIQERDAETPLEHFNLDMNFFKFVMGYIGCLQWSTSGEFKGKELENLEGRNFHKATFAKILADCLAFYQANKDDCAEAASRYDCITDRGGFGSVGHDFWLTRCGHGAGFWDGDLPKDLGDRLTNASTLAGNVDPYIGDDGLIYISGSENFNEGAKS